MLDSGVLEIAGLTAEQIGEKAAANRIVLHELTPQHASLEDAFIDLTRDEVEYKTGAPDGESTQEQAA
jgi:ABC-2 type transport system ATP-binding protein